VDSTVDCSGHDFWNQQNLNMVFYTHHGIFSSKKIFEPYLAVFEKRICELKSKSFET